MMRRSSVSASSDNPSTSNQYPDVMIPMTVQHPQGRFNTPGSELAPVGTALSPSFPGPSVSTHTYGTRLAS